MPDNRVLTDDELTNELQALPGWAASGGRLRRTYEFADFKAAIAFMVQAAFHAEALDHHPNWNNVYNRVEVELWSHDLGGVSASCTALAKAMNKLVL